MLILTRRVGETVMVGDEITVTVLGVKGNQVRIGVNAPKSVAVHREEIFERIKREGEAPPPAAVGIETEIVETTRDGSLGGDADAARTYAPGAKHYLDASGRRIGRVPGKVTR